ncbi:hypothetical protein DP42_5595 [Burkholderia pseudomallei]|nr:hypothetical protein DP42_5595 [Burkholderia pseudomallei]
MFCRVGRSYCNQPLLGGYRRIVIADIDRTIYSRAIRLRRPLPAWRGFGRPAAAARGPAAR